MPSGTASGPRRVVVTGLGAITPLGHSTTELWQAMMRGESGAAPFTRIDASGLDTRFGCEVRGFDLRFLQTIAHGVGWKSGIVLSS